MPEEAEKIVDEVEKNVQDSLELVLENSRAGSTVLLLGFPYARKPFNFERIVAYEGRRRTWKSI